MPGDGEVLAQKVRRLLRDGAQPDDVVKELVASGLSHPTAHRFVDTALDALSRPAAAPPRPSQGFLDKPLLAVALISVGLIAPLFGVAGIVIIQRDRAAKAKAVTDLADADRKRSEEIRRESQAQRTAADAERTTRQQQQLDEAVRRLTSRHSMSQCEAALLIGRIGSKEQVPLLIEVMNNDRSTSVRNCAAAGLVGLGESDTAMAAYTAWAAGDDAELRRLGISGFGDIGPSAAPVALPYLEEQLASPLMDVRYIAVDTLSKLGPAAAPLLQRAAGDPDQNVRALASKSLNALAAKK